MPILIELHTLPCIQVFAEALRADGLCLEAHENYQKGGYRNRYYIAGPNGLQILSVPLARGKHNQQAIRDVSISYTEPWQQNHWRSIQTAYGRSPFFMHYADELKEVIFNRAEKLWDWNWAGLLWCLKQLGIEMKLGLSSGYQSFSGAEYDLRDQLKPGQAEQVGFRRPRGSWPSYPQVFQDKNGFLPNLSILDLIFCQGPSAIQYLEKLKNASFTDSHDTNV